MKNNINLKQFWELIKDSKVCWLDHNALSEREIKEMLAGIDIENWLIDLLKNEDFDDSSFKKILKIIVNNYDFNESIFWTLFNRFKNDITQSDFNSSQLYKTLIFTECFLSYNKNVSLSDNTFDFVVETFMELIPDRPLLSCIYRDQRFTTPHINKLLNLLKDMDQSDPFIDLFFNENYIPYEQMLFMVNEFKKSSKGLVLNRLIPDNIAMQCPNVSFNLLYDILNHNQNVLNIGKTSITNSVYSQNILKNLHKFKAIEIHQIAMFYPEIYELDPKLNRPLDISIDILNE